MRRLATLLTTVALALGVTAEVLSGGADPLPAPESTAAAVG